MEATETAHLFMLRNWSRYLSVYSLLKILESANVNLNILRLKLH